MKISTFFYFQKRKYGIFGLKMMVKSGLNFFCFEILRAPSNICPERLNLPDRLADISEGARRISKKNIYI
jgi:hypothetical protein